MKSFCEGVVMSETTPEFRKGFEFSINCILDMCQHKKEATLQDVINLLEGTQRFIKNGYFWERK